MSEYDVLKPLVGSKLDTGVTECAKIDEYDVLNDDNVMTQADYDVTLINNDDIMPAEISGIVNDNQIGSAVSSVDHLFKVVSTLTTVSALTYDSLPSESTSHSFCVINKKQTQL